MKTRAEPYQSVIRGYETHTVLIWASLSSLASQTAGKKKVWRARAGLAQRTVSRVGVGGFRALFPCLRVKMQLRAVCPRYFLNIWGWN